MVTGAAGLFVLLMVVLGAMVFWKRGAGERREAIDIVAVINAKYPNRARHDHWLERDGDTIGDLSEFADDPDIDLGLQEADLELVSVGFRSGVRNMAPSASTSTIAPPAPPPSRRLPTSTGAPAGSSRHGANPNLARAHGRPEPPAPAPYVASGFPPPVPMPRADQPLPGEPDDLTLSGVAAGDEDGELALPDTATTGIDPFLALTRKRDKVAAQAAEAFQEVHRLRTEALRRASQAEHNATLATGARGRAGRMVRDTRRVEAQGRRRPGDVPNADDAYGDVHHFRTEALKRAQQAEHGAMKVSQARERANRLLVEQRQIEAEMAKMTRLRNAAAQ